MFPRISKTFTVLTLTSLLALPAAAVDLDSIAYVNVVEGITIVEVSALDFGDVALANGTLTVSTAGIVTDPNFLSYNGASIGQAVFTLTVVPGAAYDISFVENLPVVGLILNNFQASIDGAADVVGSDTFLGVSIANQASTMNVGADLTVDSATASIGDNQSIGYRVTVSFN
jgi:hypothetical protein